MGAPTWMASKWVELHPGRVSDLVGFDQPTFHLGAFLLRVSLGLGKMFDMFGAQIFHPPLR